MNRSTASAVRSVCSGEASRRMRMTNSVPKIAALNDRESAPEREVERQLQPRLGDDSRLE